MAFSDKKIELATKVLNTEDKDIINYIKILFDSRENDWWEELPESIKSSVKKGLKESDEGKTVPHEKARKRYSKWLEKE